MASVIITEHFSDGAKFRIDFGEKCAQLTIAGLTIPEHLVNTSWTDFYKPMLEQLAATINDPGTIWREPMRST